MRTAARGAILHSDASPRRSVSIRKTLVGAAGMFGAVVALGSATPPIAAFPGSNGRIAFVSDRHGNDEILTATADGGDVQRLTATTQSESGPAVSPDGARIAFARNQDIWVMNADGSGQTQLTGSEGSGEQSPAWSRDGKRLVFVSNRAAGGGGTTGPELWVMDADGSDVRRLTTRLAPRASLRRGRPPPT